MRHHRHHQGSGPDAADQSVLDVLVEGLARLEYRGYDSAGLAMVGPLAADGMWRIRAANGTRSLNDLIKRTKDAPGRPLSRHRPHPVGHPRRPNEGNAHPHVDCTGNLALVHNGIIENHLELSDRLFADGHHLESETDTEVLAHLVESHLAADPRRLAGAVRAALGRGPRRLLDRRCPRRDPDVIVAARRISPLIMGVSDGAAFLASDIPAILGLTHDFFILDDDQVAELRPGSSSVTTLDGDPVEPDPLHVDWDLDAARKDGFDDFMAKEMHEQPKAVADTLLDRLLPDGTLVLDEVHLDQRGVPVHHQGLRGGLRLELPRRARWPSTPSSTGPACPSRSTSPPSSGTGTRWSTATPWSSASASRARRSTRPRPSARPRRSAPRCWSSPTSSTRSMARDADAVLYTRAGPEIGVAATKTHLAQIIALEILALYLAQVRETLSPAEARGLLDAMAALPDKVAEAMERSDTVHAVAERYRTSPSFLFLGRHVGYPVALEGALKLKEISYLRAEGFPAGELKHGPIALVEPGTVVVGVATRTPVWEKMIANIAEVKSRGASVVLVANDGDEETARHADDVLWVPATEHLFAPVIDVVPLQMFAHSMARLHGLDVDRPRNLAKTVTVE